MLLADSLAETRVYIPVEIPANYSSIIYDYLSVLTVYLPAFTELFGVLTICLLTL
jgi:hypothetical protein